MGLGLLGIEVVPMCCVEIEAVAAAGLVQKMQEGVLAEAPVWSDVHTFPSELFSGRVDIVLGGYSCQPFSHCGKRAGEDDPRHLWPSIVRILGELRPRFAFFENVEGHLTLGFENVVADLERLGYTVAAGIWSAAEVGANHGRKRLFILGELADAHHEGPQGRDFGGNGRGERTVGQSGPELADAHGAGPASASRPQEQVGERGRSMADAENLFRDGGDDKPRRDVPELGNGGRPLFPPGPSDFDAWERVLEARPDLAPAVERTVRGVADGTARRVGDRTDHLRLLGNGVVPMVVGLAFATLYASLLSERRRAGGA
ncbi:MAG: DNA cytosine methyltransferase [Fimbriimonadaceae bacterium]|nr:DNA cytosine methyltransferase [Fimbriimonadaceae bacterium]